MSTLDKLFNIPFVGLKAGKHEYNFEIQDAFFEEFEYSEIKKANLKANLILDKKETMLIGQFSISGSVIAECDRCTGPIELQIKGEFKIVYKFGTEEEDDEALIVIHPDEYQINVKAPFYELIIISLPLRKIHPEGECDEEMWELVKKYTVNSEEEEEDFEEEDEEDDTDEIDWSMLKNLN
jgi:uncharacterized metal-binding protein YceD (DUF177 family)